MDFYARGYLERFTRQYSPGRPGSYRHVMHGTLKELVEYVSSHQHLTGLYRITVGTDQYTGEAIRALYDHPSFPKEG